MVSKFRREQRTEFQCPICGKDGARSFPTEAGLWTLDLLIAGQAARHSGF